MNKKKGLVNGFEMILAEIAINKLNLINLLNIKTKGVPKPNVGKTLINVPIAAPKPISDALSLVRANFQNTVFSLRLNFFKLKRFQKPIFCKKSHNNYDNSYEKIRQ